MSLPFDDVAPAANGNPHSFSPATGTCTGLEKLLATRGSGLDDDADSWLGRGIACKIVQTRTHTAVHSVVIRGWLCRSLDCSSFPTGPYQLLPPFSVILSPTVAWLPVSDSSMHPSYCTVLYCPARSFVSGEKNGVMSCLSHMHGPATIKPMMKRGGGTAG